MNLKISGVGAEPKKLVLLGLLAAVLAYFIISNHSSAPESRPMVMSVSSNEGAPAAGHVATSSPVRRRTRERGLGNAAEFHPELKPIEEAGLDRSKLDPSLRLDLLEKLQKVPVEGGSRSLFEFGQAPSVVAANIPEPAKIIPRRIYGPPLPPKDPPKPAEPPPPPVPLKFYGFINPLKAGDKRAFFLDGDDVIVATEGQTIKNRYKVVRIGVNSAVVEDTQFKNNQQTLPLVQEQAS